MRCMWHDKRYHSFVDSFVEKPLPAAKYADAEGHRVCAKPGKEVHPRVIIHLCPSCQHCLRCIWQDSRYRIIMMRDEVDAPEVGCAEEPSRLSPPMALILKCRAQKLRTLELYCGCGGLSFADRHTDRVIIETKWAVDYERSMVQNLPGQLPLRACEHPARRCPFLCPTLPLACEHIAVTSKPKW